MKSCNRGFLQRNCVVYLFFALVVCGLLGACSGGDAPLDAETKALIDSTAAARIGLLRPQLDSLCARTERTQMDHLVDSMKQVRLREIAAQLKSIPK
jgi:hypothetical protein